METIYKEKDINLFYVTADSFPAGIQAAFDKIYSFVPERKGRHPYGLTKPSQKKEIVYRAAIAEVHEGEAKELGLDTYILKKGNYQVIKIQDFMKNIPAIGASFQKMLQSPNIDPEGWCVEAYVTPNDVWCMVRQKD